MNRSSKLAALGALVLAGTLASPLAVNAAPAIDTHYGFASQTSCKAEQAKSIYNNTYVRVSKACFYKSAVYKWAFETTSIA